MFQDPASTPSSDASGQIASPSLFPSTTESDNQMNSEMFNQDSHGEGEKGDYFTIHEHCSGRESENNHIADMSGMDPSMRHTLNIMAENSLYKKV